MWLSRLTIAKQIPLPFHFDFHFVASYTVRLSFRATRVPHDWPLHVCSAEDTAACLCTSSQALFTPSSAYLTI